MQEFGSYNKNITTHKNPIKLRHIQLVQAVPGSRKQDHSRALFIFKAKKFLKLY